MAEYENGRDYAARLAKEQKADDDAQWRRYAEAAMSSWGETHHGHAYRTGNSGYYGASVVARVCGDWADAMLAQQKRRGR